MLYHITDAFTKAKYCVTVKCQVAILETGLKWPRTQHWVCRQETLKSTERGGQSGGHYFKVLDPNYNLISTMVISLESKIGMKGTVLKGTD